MMKEFDKKGKQGKWRMFQGNNRKRKEFSEVFIKGMIAEHILYMEEK